MFNLLQVTSMSCKYSFNTRGYCIFNSINIFFFSISSAIITFGLIDLINIFIPSAFGMLSITSVLIPKSFWDIPLYVADNSPLSSTTPHVTPLKLNSGIPLLIFFIISFKSVVFPKPGWRNYQCIPYCIFI